MVVGKHMLVSGQIELCVVLGALSETERVVLVSDAPNFDHWSVRELLGISFEVGDSDLSLICSGHEQSRVLNFVESPDERNGLAREFADLVLRDVWVWFSVNLLHWRLSNSIGSKRLSHLRLGHLIFMLLFLLGPYFLHSHVIFFSLLVLFLLGLLGSFFPLSGGIFLLLFFISS